MKFTTTLLSFLFLISFSTQALSTPDHHHPKPKTSPQFDTLKSLEGTWVGEGTMHGKKEKVRVDYKISSGGTIVEEIFP